VIRLQALGHEAALGWAYAAVGFGMGIAGLLLILGCLDEPGAAMNLTADDCATARCYR
jgi:hypothetical protein